MLPIRLMGLICSAAYTLSLIFWLYPFFSINLGAASELQLCAIMVILIVPLPLQCTQVSILGDCGSLFLGSLMSLLLIRLFPSDPLGKLHVFLLFGGVAY